MFGLPPAMLHRPEHTGKLGFPMSFPHPHQRAPTGFVSLQEYPPCVVKERAVPPNHHRPDLSRSGSPLNPSKFVIPVKLDASIFEAHVHRQVVRMAEGSLYGANAPFPDPSGSIQHPHQRADTRLMRFQVLPPLDEDGAGPTSDPNHSAFPAVICNTLLHLFV